MSSAHYLLETLPTDRPYTWTLTVDPNKRHAGLLVAEDHLGTWYVVAEYYREGVADSLHAAAYQQMLAARSLRPNQDVAIYADPGGAGAQAIVNMAEVGLYAQPVVKDAGSVKASIERVRRQAWIDPGHPHPLTGATGAPKLYFLRSLRSRWTVHGVEYAESRLLWELRQYRHKPNGRPDQPIKQWDDCVDCLRYVALVRPLVPKVTDDQVQRARAKIDRLSQQAEQEYEDLVKQVLQPKVVVRW